MIKNKRVLVTGGCGTVGTELVRQLLTDSYDIAELIVLDNNESELFFLEQRWMEDGRVSFFLGDIRDRDKLCRKMQGVDIVFHAAAFKHVILCERSPFEAVQTNIQGVQNIIYAACECGVKKVIFTSSDKAVNPSSVMGTSKLMGERLITAANSSGFSSEIPIFASTRFGNVLGSSGSVIPIFAQQIKNGGPVTLTDPGMSRFVMSIKDAVSLVIHSVAMAKGGEVFITKMPVINIKDLAEVMIEELAPMHGFDPKHINLEIIGVKPGEKMYEELMSPEEIRRALELSQYFVVLPAFRDIYKTIHYQYGNQLVSGKVDKPYVSSDELALSKEALRSFLQLNGLLTV